MNRTASTSKTNPFTRPKKATFVSTKHEPTGHHSPSRRDGIASAKGASASKASHPSNLEPPVRFPAFPVAALASRLPPRVNAALVAARRLFSGGLRVVLPPQRWKGTIEHNRNDVGQRRGMSRPLRDRAISPLTCGRFAGNRPSSTSSVHVQRSHDVLRGQHTLSFNEATSYLNSGLVDSFKCVGMAFACFTWERGMSARVEIPSLPGHCPAQPNSAPPPSG